MIITLLIIGLVICILLSAFFSASEMSYSSCNEKRIENLKDEGNKKAAKAFKIIERFDDSLSAILIGNNLVNIASSSIGSVLVYKLLKSNNYAWLSTLVITILVIIFGETIPKIIAKKRSNSLSLSFAYPIRFLTVIFTPIIKLVVFLVEKLTKNIKEEITEDEDEAIDEAIDELSSIIETAEDEDVLDEDQSELVQAAIDFLDASAFEVMTARVDIVAIDIDDSIEETEKIINESGFSRIPVYKDSIDNIIGILHINHYLKAKTDNENVDINSLLLKPCFVYRTNKLTSVLKQLKKLNQHMAIVCDEYGGTDGIITMEDILEEIVGEIWDESDIIEEDVKELSETVFEIDGDFSIADFCDTISIDEDSFETESETIGGWVLEHFESYPSAGSEFETENLKVKILEIEDRRIIRVKVEIIKNDNENL